MQNDVEGFAGLLTSDATIVNIAGRRVVGRDQIRAAMGQALATPLAQVITRHEIEDVRFVRPDVAVVACLKHVSDQRDERATALPQTGRLTVILVKEQGRWLVTSLQTTPLAA